MADQPPYTSPAEVLALAQSVIKSQVPWIRDYLTGFAGVVPDPAPDNKNLGSPASPTIYVGSDGTYFTPSGNIVTTANLNLFFWKGTTWRYLPIPINVDLTQYLKKSSIYQDLTGTDITQGVFYDLGSHSVKDSAGTESTNYIPVTPGQTILASAIVSQYNGVAGLDANKNFVVTLKNNATNLTITDFEIVIPSGVYLVIASSLSNNNFVSIKLEIPIKEIADKARNASTAIANGNFLKPYLPSVEPGFLLDKHTDWQRSTEQWKFVKSNMLISYGNLGNALLPGLSGTSDYGGVREGQIYIETINNIETWFFFYGAGDGTNTTAGEWRIQLAISTDKGVTWTRTGPINIGLQNGSGTALQGRDMLILQKWNGVYYMHAMKSEGNSAATDRGRVPIPPYESDVWSLPDAGNGPVGNWTFLRNTFVKGAGSAYDNYTAYINSVVFKDGSYHAFFNVTNLNGSTLNLDVAHAIGTDPAGPYTKDANSLFGSVIYPLVPENPKVFWYDRFNCWVMLLNEGTRELGTTNRNAYVFSDSLTTWSFTRHYFSQLASEADGHYAVGIANPLTTDDNLPVITPGGYIPYIYDLMPLASTQPNIHVGRRQCYSVLEPSGEVLQYNSANLKQRVTLLDERFSVAGNLQGRGAWVLAKGTAKGGISGGKLSLGTSVGELVLLNTASVISGTGSILSSVRIGSFGGVGLVFYAQDNNNFYWIDINCDNRDNPTISLWKCVGGTETEISAEIALADKMYFEDFNEVVLNISGQTFTLIYKGQTYTLTGDGTFASGYCGLRNSYVGSNATRDVLNFKVISENTISTTARQTAYRNLYNANFVTEFACFMDSSGTVTVGATNNPDLSFDFRIQANGDCYRLKMVNTLGIELFTVIGGVEKSVIYSFGTDVFKIGYANRVRLEVQDSNIVAYLNGQKQLQSADNTFLHGLMLGYSAFGTLTGGIRNSVLYAGNKVTIANVPDGGKVSIRSHGGIPLQTKIASGGIAEFELSHFPVEGFDVNGDYVVPEGFIWGGQTIDYK